MVGASPAGGTGAPTASRSALAAQLPRISVGALESLIGLAFFPSPRAVESRKDKHPLAVDLPPGTEQDADTIVFAYRPALYASEMPPQEEVHLIVGKQRSGPAGICAVRFEPSCGRFSSVLPPEPDGSD